MILMDDDAIKVSLHQGEHQSVVFCFTGVGHAMGGIDVQKDEFHRVTAQATTIFITDKKRSWGNNLDFKLLATLLEPHVAGKQLYALGNSMGGFLAILASRYFPFKVVVSFAPQFSVSKNVIPEENRWDRYVEKIERWAFPSLEGCFMDEVQYYVFGDGSPMERRHLDRFPVQDNIRKIIINDVSWNHSIAQQLKKRGVLYDCIESCIGGKDVETIKKIIQSASDEDVHFAF